MTTKLRSFTTPAAVADAAAALVVDAARTAITARGRLSIALSGGSTPKALFTLLAQPAWRDFIDWANVWVCWSDERHLPPGNPERCDWLAYTTLLNYVPIPNEQIIPVPYDGLDVESAAAAYQERLVAAFGTPLMLDLILLGMGPDGHTASIFPHQPEAESPGDALVIPVYNSPKPPPLRVSLSYAAINAARQVVFLVTGADKAAMVQRIRSGDAVRVDVPAAGVKPTSGDLVWLMDAAAGA